MKYIVDSKTMKKIDDYSIQDMKIPALVLMERAAKEIAAVITNKIEKTDRILVVCGTGNNGGDGVAAGRILYLQGYPVAICFVGDKNKSSEQMKLQLEIAQNLGIPMENSNKLSEYNVIIDAIFGVGLSRGVTGEQETVIRRINTLNAKVFAVDIPSGISADSGLILNVAVKATDTITFGYKKLGLLFYPGAEYVGNLVVADIGFAQEAITKLNPSGFYYEQEDINRIPKRQNYSHKGTYGKVLIIAGSKGMAGAAYLSAKAAYRSGAGLVKILSTEMNRNILQTSLPEAIFAAYDEEGIEPEDRILRLLADLSWAKVIVIGPGLGQSQLSAELVDTVIKNAKVPVVMDADGLTLLAKRLDYDNDLSQDSSLESRLRKLESLLPNEMILTPHLMELSRLLEVPITNITNNVVDTVNQCSYNSKLIYVIKDARTIVARQDKRYINVSGNHGMATGGSGDVLTGIIAALIAQGMVPYEAACLAVYLHGLAGDEAAKEKGAYSMMASDILDSIEKILINLG